MSVTAGVYDEDATQRRIAQMKRTRTKRASRQRTAKYLGLEQPWWAGGLLLGSDLGPFWPPLGGGGEKRANETHPHETHESATHGEVPRARAALVGRWAPLYVLFWPPLGGGVEKKACFFCHH